MLRWIEQHSASLQLIASVAMLAVWMAYLQLFWKGYRRQLMANILINRGAGAGLESRCLISNMSAEAVFIEGIILVLEREGKRWSTAMTNITGISGDEQAQEPGSTAMHEGPLAAGAYMDVGRFETLLEKAREAVQPPLDDADGLGFDAFDIWVIAHYGAENRLVFVRRKFEVGRHNGRWTLRPEQIETEQVRSGEKRRRIERMLQDHLEELSPR